MESTSFAFIGSTKSGKRAEADERDFTSSVALRYRLSLNRKSPRGYMPMAGALPYSTLPSLGPAP
jgi:hypothetical protein